jgi:hypothetical protein
LFFYFIFLLFFFNFINFLKYFLFYIFIMFFFNLINFLKYFLFYILLCFFNFINSSFFCFFIYIYVEYTMRTMGHHNKDIIILLSWFALDTSQGGENSGQLNVNGPKKRDPPQLTIWQPHPIGWQLQPDVQDYLPEGEGR